MLSRTSLVLLSLLLLAGCGGPKPGKTLEKKSKGIVIAVARQDAKVTVKVTEEGKGGITEVELPVAEWDALNLKPGDLCDLLLYSVVTVEKTSGIKARSKEDVAPPPVPTPPMINPPANFR